MSKDARWFRLNVTWDDSSWLADLPWHVRAVWPIVLAHVKVHGTMGACDATPLRRFAGAHDIPFECVEAFFEAATKGDDPAMVVGDRWTVTRWKTYQASESLDRVHRYRDKQKQDVTDCNVTEHNETLPCHATETGTTTETCCEVQDGSSPVSLLVSPRSKPTARQRKKFEPPSAKEVADRCAEIELPKAEGRKFFDHHEARGWKLKTGPMVSWHAALSTWKTNWQEGAFSAIPATNGRHPPGVLAGEAPPIPDPDMLRR